MNPITNEARTTIDAQTPYVVEVTIEGNTMLLLHGWNNEAVQIKTDSKKGSKTKKTDDLESYVRRDDEGYICIPGEYIRQSLIAAAKTYSDPRSPRKSLSDLTKASIVCEDELSRIISATDGEPALTWDLIDYRRAVIQRAAITRQRPAFRKGYRVTFRLMVLVPEYFERDLIYKLISDAGRFCGIGDFRPTYGRFDIVKFDLVAHL